MDALRNLLYYVL